MNTKMTLDDAIAHAKQIAADTECKECAEDHCQLAEWLEELKSLRENYEQYNMSKEQLSYDN